MLHYIFSIIVILPRVKAGLVVMTTDKSPWFPCGCCFGCEVEVNKVVHLAIATDITFPLAVSPVTEFLQ